MAEMVGTRKVKAQLSRLVRRAQRSDSVILTHRSTDHQSFDRLSLPGSSSSRTASITRAKPSTHRPTPTTTSSATTCFRPRVVLADFHYDAARRPKTLVGTTALPHGDRPCLTVPHGTRPGTLPHWLPSSIPGTRLLQTAGRPTVGVSPADPEGCSQLHARATPSFCGLPH